MPWGLRHLQLVFAFVSFHVTYWLFSAVQCTWAITMHSSVLSLYRLYWWVLFFLSLFISLKLFQTQSLGLYHLEVSTQVQLENLTLVNVALSPTRWWQLVQRARMVRGWREFPSTSFSFSLTGSFYMRKMASMERKLCDSVPFTVGSCVLTQSIIAHYLRFPFPIPDIITVPSS